MIPIGDENPNTSFPLINTLLLVTNIGVFLYGVFHPDLYDVWIRQFAFVASEFWHSPFEHAFTLITYTFLHGGWGHIVGNMLFLYIFGDNVEDRLGHLSYLFFYFLAAIGGALLQGWFLRDSYIPMIGASAAISAIVIAYMFFFPTKNVVTLMFLGFFLVPVRIPAFFYILGWASLQVVYSLLMVGNMSLSGGVAYLAHLGGIVIGILWVIFGPKKTLRVRSRW
ncbi:rhomboid family intramembrane serine protease [Thermospira aquatica]|uniref:Rhomboid family intramembrane serine protease n=1 Tax=Thermospira aquatica TaxID=2828656 RepID=A0AAX3BF69_9SPIR|nr:rhomboid family intramembrane serine protease [Thermospira aquatica]URA10773.1 rhomboid family intramembrane serine protease [Thermospira aquatica]